MLTVLRSLQYTKTLPIIIRSTKRLLANAITGEHKTLLNEETLTGRLLIYFNGDKQEVPLQEDFASEIIKNKREIKDSLKRCNLIEIIHLFKYLEKYEAVLQMCEAQSFLNALDDECSRRVPKKLSNVQDIFSLLHIYMKIVPNRIVNYKFYKKSIGYLNNLIHLMNKNELMQLMFFIGLKKKWMKDNQVWKTCLDRIDDSMINKLTTEDICVICNATFKAGTKISNKLVLDKIITHFYENLCIMKDPQLFTTVTKTVRLNRVQDNELLSTVSDVMFFNKTYVNYNMTSYCHLLNLYASYYYFDEKLVKFCASKCLEEIKKGSYVTTKRDHDNILRTKDFQLLLWGLSNLSYKLDKTDIKNIVIPKILGGIENREFGKLEPDRLVNILLYLWMMDYRAYELIAHVMTNENVDVIRSEKLFPKNQLSLNLFLYCIWLEDKQLYRRLNINYNQVNSISMYAPKYQLEQRPLLNKIVHYLNRTSKEYGLDIFKIRHQIPYINILGITGYRENNKLVNIEILDNYTALKNTENTPTGLMKLKLRLLDKSDQGLIVIEADEFEDMSEEGIQGILQDEISLVC